MKIVERVSLLLLVSIQLVLIGAVNIFTLKRISSIEEKLIRLKSEYEVMLRSKDKV